MMFARQRPVALAGLMGLVGIALGMILAPASAAACSFIFPPWYTVTTTIQAPPLPPGVTLVEVPEDPPGIGAKKLRISNTSATPLYIIAALATGNTDFEPIDHQFPDSRGPVGKVVDGVASRWAAPWYTGQDQWTWEQKGPAATLYVTDERITADDGIVARFANNTGPDRPAGAPPPAPERLVVPLVYGTTLITIPMTVTYSLNPDYDPTVGIEGCGKEEGAMLMLGLAIGTAALAAIALGWLIRRMVKRRKRRIHGR